jgi:cytochrome oxidase Cu insertion factor (SCO1/SenC/PrrC family)
MKLSPRAKLLLIAALFALPMVASFIAYKFFPPPATGNYGELLLPPATITAHPFGRPEGGTFAFGDLRGKWVLVASDSGECPDACAGKLVAMRQARLALGRNAGRLERVLVVDDLKPLDGKAVAPFEGTAIALTPAGLSLPSGAANDRAHIYLVDPHGNVMMRWPAKPDWKRMLKDLERLLKASQIG